MSLRLRSARGWKVYATEEPSGETSAPHSSPSGSRSPCSRTSRRGHGSSTSTTARREVSSRSMETTSVFSSSQTGLPASSSRLGGPPSIETSHTAPWSAYATVRPSGETAGVVSSQYGIGSRPVVSRCATAPCVKLTLGVSSTASSSVQRSEVSRSWMKASVRPSGASARLRGRSVAAIASRRQCGGGFDSRFVGVGTPPYSSLPIQTSSGSGTSRRSRPRLPRAPRARGPRARRDRIPPPAQPPSAGRALRAPRRPAGTPRP